MDVESKKSESTEATPEPVSQGEQMGGFISTKTEKNHYQNKINSIDSEINVLETEISTARERIDAYDKSAKSLKARRAFAIDVESKVSDLEAKIISLESQKIEFEDLKNGINTDESIVR